MFKPVGPPEGTPTAPNSGWELEADGDNVVGWSRVVERDADLVFSSQRLRGGDNWKEVEAVIGLLLLGTKLHLEVT